MKYSYKFSNLLGTFYRRGNLTFTPDGSSLLSPVGNRLSVFHLKNNNGETLPLATRCNISCVALSPDGSLVILVDEEGSALLVSLITKSVLNNFNFQQPVHSISFSPDGRKFVVCKGSLALMYHAPGKRREFNAFALDKTFYGPYDETTCIDWTNDSRCFAVGSKDMSTWVFGAERWQQLIYYSIGGHKDAIVSCFFLEDSLDLYTISADAALCMWQCDMELSQLLPRAPKKKPAETEDVEKDKGEEIRGMANPAAEEKIGRVSYSRKIRHFFNKDGDFTALTAAAFHKKLNLLVTGFSSGTFHIHELPEVSLIHSLSISDQSISSITINSTGDWIAFGSSGLGQLLVWEWQSESYVLKQQGHFNNMVSLCYSPDGQHIVTGGDDGKVKVWDTSSGFCFVTFTDHTSSITAVTFTSNGQAVLSASLDGTVRAFSLLRYRNFRTFTSPRPTQFSCLAVDSSGDIVCAGGQDSFEVYVWSIQTGRLLDVLAGHEGPISSIAFNPCKSVLATASWDQTVRLWHMTDSWRTTETFSLNADALAVTFRPDGEELAVASLDGQITMWDPEKGTQTGSIEGRHDLQMGRKELDKVTAKHSAKGKAFTTLCYSADGQALLAGGSSRFVCIYHTREQLLAKKFEISCNYSLDAMEEFLDRRKMTEFGSLALIDEGAGDEGGVALSLPGVRKGDMSSRRFKPEIRVTALRFSPTGRSWATTSTEGLLIFSLDSSTVFDPFQLDEEVTAGSVRRALRAAQWTRALVMAMRLNEESLLQETLESVPCTDIKVLCSSLPELYVERLLAILALQIERSRHLQFYLMWAHELLMQHGQKMKSRSVSLLPAIHSLWKSIQTHFNDISKLCDWNRYNMKFAVCLSRQRGMKRLAEDGDEEGGDSDVEEGGDSDVASELASLEDMMEEIAE
ncbi:periodic tryptophan protein 2 homolog [Rana temporaria]|uniref:periodic tryptophan protein 2 homolog n=1 Tax=Rana temporaria TaxID=8407 RepID=UPI001AADF623|nr:periodic tryptophan protein 2 homolog [Rana temporaria]